MNLPVDEKERLKEVMEKLEKAVEKNVKGLEKVGVLFSGGLDSAVLAKIASNFSNVTCYCAGLEKSHDILFAQKATQAMNLKLKKKIIEKDEVENYAKKVIAAIGTEDMVQTGVGIPLYACCEIAEEKVLLSGTGADEIFGGYARFRNLEGKELKNELQKTYEKMLAVDAKRDIEIGKATEKKIKMPFIECGLTPIGEKGKTTLRKIALEIGIPKFIAEHPKKAAQYGSGVDKLLRKMQKQAF